MLGIIHRERSQHRAPVLDAPVKNIHAAEKVHDERTCRPFEHILRTAVLFHPAFVHDHHPISQLQRFLLIVGDEDAGEMNFFVEPAEPAAELLAHLCVQRPERLVQQKHSGLHSQGARQRDALPLAAG